MYCKNCGKEIDDKAEICTECGNRTLSPNVPSKLWYVLILFGIIGGIIGYILLKNKDKSMARNILVIGIGINILALISNTNQPNVKQSDQKTSVVQQENPIVKVSETAKPIYTTQNDDKRFLEWTRGSMIALGADIKDVSDAAMSSNFKLVEIYGKTLKDDSKNYLDQIDEFSVSSNVKDIFDEYKAALEDLYLTGKYAEQGAKNVDSNDIKTAGDYMSKATEHINTVAALAKSKT